MNKKIRVGVIFGGESFEHDVSKMTAKSILDHIDRSLFDPIEIFIDKNGEFDEKKLNDIDIAFLAVHGPNCEDGKLQEYLEKKGIKYTGSGVKASKVNMSKSMMHNSFKNVGLPVVKYAAFNKKDYKTIAEKVVSELEFPVFVKPDNAGSSVGISKVKDKEELDFAINEAFKYDDNIVIEQAVRNPREIEIAVLGNENLIVSKPGEVLTGGEFYSYDTKYFHPFGTTTKIDDLSNEQVNRFQELSKKAYISTGCKGYARIDFFLDENQNIFISEINTLPGFTSISMYPKLVGNIGIEYPDLITRIINLGLE